MVINDARYLEIGRFSTLGMIIGSLPQGALPPAIIFLRVQYTLTKAHQILHLYPAASLHSRRVLGQSYDFIVKKHLNLAAFTGNLLMDAAFSFISISSCGRRIARICNDNLVSRQDQLSLRTTPLTLAQAPTEVWVKNASKRLTTRDANCTSLTIDII